MNDVRFWPKLVAIAGVVAWVVGVGVVVYWLFIAESDTEKDRRRAKEAETFFEAVTVDIGGEWNQVTVLPTRPHTGLICAKDCPTTYSPGRTSSLRIGPELAAEDGEALFEALVASAIEHGSSITCLRPWGYVPAVSLSLSLIHI